MHVRFKNNYTFYFLILIFSLNSAFGNQLPEEIQIPEPKIESLDQIIIDEEEFANQEIPGIMSDAIQAISDEDKSDLAESPQEQLEKFLAKAEENERCEMLLKEVIANFDKLDFALEHIALVVNNNQVRIANQKPILEEIINLRSIVGMIRNGAFVVIKPENLGQLIDLAQKLLMHVRYLLTTNLINFKPFDFEGSTITRLQLPKTYGFEQLEKMLKQNDSLLENLESESENVGLSSFNMMYRKLEKLNNDYKILNRAAIAAGIGVGIVWIGYLTPPYFWNKVTNFFGWNQNGSNNSGKNINVFEGEEISSSSPLLSDSDSEIEITRSNNSSTRSSIPHREIQRDTTPAPDIKAGIGERLVDEHQSMNMDATLAMEAQGKHVGFITRTHDLIERHYKIISFTATPISLYALVSPTLKDWGTYSYQWVSKKMAQIASFLRGGPLKRQMDVWAEKDIKITFDDVIGNEHAKQTLAFIVSYILDYEKYDRAGIVPETGILLVGPPRTGKTFIAEALAGTIKAALQERGSNETIRLLSFTASELKQHGIANILLGAKILAPVVLFIDEIDTGRFQREGDAAALGELQIAMSTLSRDKSKKVIIVAATNKPENLDFSLLEPGRFGKRIDFTYPTTSERKEFLLRELSKRAVTISEDYIDRLAHESERCSYDALNEVIVTALQRAKIRGSILTWQDLEAAFDEEVNKIILDEETIPEAEQYVIAAHQAGHAYMRILRNASLELTKVTIRPTSAKINEQAVYAKYFDENKRHQRENSTIEYGKVFTAHNANSLKLESYKDLINELIISLAGHIAEKILFESSSYSYHTIDKEQALGLAKHLVFGGLQEKDMPKAIREQKLTEAYELLQKCENEATEILAAHKKELIIITNILFEQKTLMADEIMQIIELLEEQRAKKAQKDSATNPSDENDSNDDENSSESQDETITK